MNSTQFFVSKFAPLFLVAASSTAMAFDEEMYAISAVPRSEPKTIILGINHAFLTKIVENKKLAKDLSEKNFGLRGSNVAITGLWIPVEHLAFRALAGSRGGNVQLGASGNYSFEHVSADAGVNFVLHQENDDFKKSWLPFVSFGAPGLFKEYNVDLALNAMYDTYNSLASAGVGASYNFGREHRLFVEYFPRISKVNTKKIEQGEKNTFGFGYRYHSFGHQYFLVLTNSAPVDMRQAALGAENNDLGIAIRVNREM